jgi:hypothetical protein
MAGKEKNVPPPAMAFMPPARNAPAPTTAASKRVIEVSIEEVQGSILLRIAVQRLRFRHPRAGGDPGMRKVTGFPLSRE